MGSKNDGKGCDHIKSDCCNKPVRYKVSSSGYSVETWCSECGHYFYSGRIEGLIALWFGNLAAVEKNKGYVPKWASSLENHHIHLKKLEKRE